MTIRFEKLISSLKAASNLQFLTWLTGFCSLCFFLLIRFPEIFYWDDFSYLMDIYSIRPSIFLLGRPGFTLLFGSIWSFAYKFGLDFSIFEKFIQIFNVTALSLVYVFILKMLVMFRVKPMAAFITILLLLSELGISAFSFRIIDSQLMYLAVVLSYFYFIKAHEASSLKLLRVSALWGVYAFLVREPGAFFWFFYIVLYFVFKKQKKHFVNKSYYEFAAVLISLSLLGPLTLYLVYGDQYVDIFMRSFTSTNYLAPIGAINIIKEVLAYQFNAVTLPISLLGLYCAIKKYGSQWVAVFLTVCLFPIIITASILELEALREARFYLGLFLIFAFCQTLALEFLYKKLIHLKNIAVLCTAAIFIFTAYFTFVRYLPNFKLEKANAISKSKYYEELKPLLKDDVVIILGAETQIVKYRSHVDGLTIRAINPGISWPTDFLITEILLHLSAGRKVIYDPRSKNYLKETREADLKKMENFFKLEPIEKGFVKVVCK